MSRTLCGGLLLGFMLLVAAAATRGQELPPDAGASAPAEEDFDAQADSFEALSQHEFLLQGNVTFSAGGVLLQADRVLYDSSTRTGEADGSILYVQGPMRVSGEHITFDLGASTAEISDATGYLDEGFLFRARRILQLDARRIRFEHGFFTACTQPVPYWSFHVSSGVIVRERYVHLYNLTLKAGKVPVFYSPYLVFPIKPERATGLLLPQIGFSQRLGSSLGNAFFWDIRRNQDATFYLDAYSEGSVGTGVEYRLLPNARGAAILNGYFIQENNLDLEEQPERRRWNARYKQRQDFDHGGRLQADFNLVSDADYYLDFSRDPDRGSDPSALSRAEYVLNRGYTSLNLRGERREQFFRDGDVVQSRLPETELRLRSRRLGQSPFFLALESSASLLDRSAPGFPRGTYGRLDVFPAISAPISPRPYLDLTPTLRLRETFYSRGLDVTDPAQFGSSLSREFVQFDVQMQGPRLSRIFFDRQGNGRYKSTIEPRLTYRFQTAPGSEDNFRVPGFDEIDILPGDVDEIEYGVVSRLFARRLAPAPSRSAEFVAAEEILGRRPRALDEPPDLALEARPGAEEEEPPDMLSSPVEIAAFSVTQRYSFMNSLAKNFEFVDTDGDGFQETLATVDESFFSPVALGGRFNPSPWTSVDTRVEIDTLESTVSSASLSAGLYHPRRGFLSSTWFFRNGLDGRSLNSSRLRVDGGTSFFRHKISMAVSLNYDATLSSLQDQRYRFGYDTQCCGFAVEILERDFVGTEQREFRFVVNLRGIGNFIDLQGGGTGR